MGVNTSWSNRLVADLQQDFGLSLGAAQGLAGAFAMESEGFNTMQERKPTVAGSRGGYGMAQWTGVRRKAFESYAASSGYGQETYEAQYGYLRRELQGKGGHDGGIIRKLKNVDDPQAAQQLVTQKFLRPGITHANARADWTNQVVSSYTKLPPGMIPDNAVGTQLDVQELGKKIAPTPKDRMQGTIARTKGALGINTPQTSSLVERVGQMLDAEPVRPRPRVEGTAARTNAAIEKNNPGMPRPRPDRTATPAPKANDVGMGADFYELGQTNDWWKTSAKGASDNIKKVATQALLPEIAPPKSAPAPTRADGSAGQNRQAQASEQRAQQGAKKVTQARLPELAAPGSMTPKKEAPTPAPAIQRKAAESNASMQGALQMATLLDDGIAVVDAQKKGGPIPAAPTLRDKARERAQESSKFDLGQAIQDITGITAFKETVQGVSDMFSGKGPGGGNGNNIKSDSGYSVYRPSEGYGSKGYSTITSPGGTHQYDRDSGSWQEVSKPSSSSSSGKKK